MTGNAAVKIILVVKDPARKVLYLDSLEGFGLSMYLLSSLQEAISHAEKEAHCGILIDMPLMIHAKSAIKSALEDLLKGLPSATINVSPASGDIRILPRGELVAGCFSLGSFVDICRSVQPKFIFLKKRETVNYNVLVDTNPEMTAPERTVCIDISAVGCFLFCVRDDIYTNSSVWMRFIDIGDDTVICGTVVWKRDWGTCRAIPGIGIEFKNVSDAIRKKIITDC